MQWFILFALLLSLLCLIMGWHKSGTSQNKPRPVLQHCASCGWTTEQVQSCQFERNRFEVVAPLCFECAIEREAVPAGRISAIAS